MASLFLTFIFLITWRNNTASEEKSVVFYHVLDYSVKPILVVAMLYIYIKVLYHLKHIIWTFKTQLVNQRKAFTYLFLFFIFILNLFFIIRTIYIGGLFIRVRLNVFDFNTLNLVIRSNYVTFPNLQRILLWTQSIQGIFSFKHNV